MAKVTLNSIDLGEAPPKEFRLFKRGENPTTKGVLLFDDQSAGSVMELHAALGNDMPIDYCHGMFAKVQTAETGKAAGWLSPDVREGELWASSVTWTPAAADAITNREYRYVSPTVDVDEETGQIMRLHNVALTNLPATIDQTPLVAHNKDTQDMSKLLKALGADSEDHGIKIAKESFAWASRILAALGCEQQDGVALAKLEQLKQQAATAQGLAEKLAEAEQKIEAARLEKENLAKETLLDSMTESGKIVPGAREFWASLSLAQLTHYDESAQPANPANTDPQTGSPVMLGELEKRVYERDCKPLGITPEQYAASRRAAKGTK